MMNFNLGSLIAKLGNGCRIALIVVMAAASAMAQAKSAHQLHDEVQGYIGKRIVPGGRPQPEVLERLKAEQRQLAARYAAELAGRSDRQTNDEYYLGLLYHLAGDAPHALATMRQFLANNPDFNEAGKQSARIVIARNATTLKQYDEAERALEEYAKNRLRQPETLYVIEAELAYALFKDEKYDRVPAHARAAFEAAKQIRAARTSDVFNRDTRLMNLASLMSDAYYKLKKKDEALNAILELRDVALDLPSTNLYRMVRVKLRQMGKGSEADGLIPAEKAQYEAPELLVAHWLDEEKLTLADLRGRVVIVDFWATWCGPCRRMFPTLSRWQEKYRDKGLVVIGLTHLEGQQDQLQMTPEEELRYLQEFKKKHELSYHIGVARTTTNSFNYGVRGIPSTVLIDRRGMVRFMSVGVSDDELSLLNGMVGKLLKEQEQTPPKAPGDK